jgi:DNA-binding MarR family transcriptional regulator
MPHDKIFNQYRTLLEISNNKGKTSTEIIKKLEIGGTAARKTLAFFYKKDLISKCGGRNGREKSIEITSKGIEMLGHLKKVVEMNS